MSSVFAWKVNKNLTLIDLSIYHFRSQNIFNNEGNPNLKNGGIDGTRTRTFLLDRQAHSLCASIPKIKSIIPILFATKYWVDWRDSNSHLSQSQGDALPFKLQSTGKVRRVYRKLQQVKKLAFVNFAATSCKLSANPANSKIGRQKMKWSFFN